MSDAAYLANGLRKMQESDLQGGKVTIANQDYDCAVGTFEKRDVFSGSGVVQKMMGDVQVLFADLPTELELSVGLQITVTPNSGKVRECQLHATQNAGNYVNIMLEDINEGA